MVQSGSSTRLNDASPDKYGGKVLEEVCRYSVVPGWFVQSNPTVPAEGYDLLEDRFGLVDKSPEGWDRLAERIVQLNTEADDHTAYKLLFLARHGEGFHNVAESRYGKAAWDSHWAQLTGDGESVWGPDPLLTPKGIQQAEAANAAWKREIKAGAPLPQSLYSSPLQRSATTLQIAWQDILLDKETVPHFKEKFRERLGDHTCDQRSTRTEISQIYPGWTFDDSFTEQDQLFDGSWESDEQLVERVLSGLEGVFRQDPSSILSITAHSGTINAFLRGFGHRPFQLLPGGFIPVLLKVSNDPSEAEA